jgi:hypothetical protein
MTIEPNGQALQPNAQKTYAALRADLPGTDGVTVKELALEREGVRRTNSPTPSLTPQHSEGMTRIGAA